MAMRFAPVAVLLVATAAGCSVDAGAQTPQGAGARAVSAAAPPGTPSCATTSAEFRNDGDYANVVYRDGLRFIASEPVSDVAFGAVVGTVRCTISGSMTPADYEGRDGDATYVHAGHPLYQVAGRSPSEAVGGYLKGPRYAEGHAYIFVTEQEYRERSAGRCDVPLTRPCTS